MNTGRRPVTPIFCDASGGNGHHRRLLSDGGRPYGTICGMGGSPRLHQRAFEAARCIHGISPERSWEVYDQGCLGLGVKWSGTPLHRLPPDFNRCGLRLWDHWTPKMDSYIWHFCGKKTWDALQNTNWKEID